ncbi:MAG: hypothetical protein JXI43_05705 [Tissierellales bacterium]|nr:hypothetical protein [Tissierellales bacterium]
MNGDFVFIESKLPGDKIGKNQIAGMALIKKHLSVVRPVSIAIYNLIPEKTIPLKM